MVNGYPVFRFDAGSQYNQAITGPTPLTPFQWAHLAAVYHPGSPNGLPQNWATPANGASVTVSDGSGAGNAIDGNVSSKAQTTSTANAWLRLDLGRVRQMNRIVVRSYNEDSPPTATLTLSTDTGAVTWTTTTSLAGKQVFSLPNPFGRYLQIQLNAEATDPLAIYEITIEGADQPYRELYVNGQLVASDAVPAPTESYNSVYIGAAGNSSSGYDFYRGYLDQVQFYPFAATTAVCAQTNCPTVAPPGRLSRSALFRDSEFSSVPMAQTIDTEFTLSAWVKGLSGDYPTGNILTLQVGAIPFAQMGIDATGLPIFTANASGSLTYLSSNPLRPNQWYYLVWRHSETADNRAIFVNGQKIAEGAAGTRPVGDLDALIGSLLGQVDDITVHSLALTDQEITRQYAYQSSWTEIADDNRIIVDSEAPNLHLAADLPDYLPQQTMPIFLALTALSDDPFAVTSVDVTGTAGQVTDNGDGTFDYDPDGQFEPLGAGETGSDSFRYTVSDIGGVTATAVVSLTISGVNDAPAAAGDTAVLDEDTAITIATLTNDSGVDNGAVLGLEGVGLPGQGTAVISNTTILYTRHSTSTGQMFLPTR